MCKYCEALKEDTKKVILSSSSNGCCSIAMSFEHKKGDIIIDSFVLSATEMNTIGIIINYCPICGTKLEINHD